MLTTWKDPCSAITAAETCLQNAHVYCSMQSRAEPICSTAKDLHRNTAGVLQPAPLSACAERARMLTDAVVLEPFYACQNAVILQQLSCERLAGVPPPAVLCAAAGKEEDGRERQAAAPGAAQGHQRGHRSRPAHCPHRRLWSWQGDPAQRGTYLAMALPTLHCCKWQSHLSELTCRHCLTSITRGVSLLAPKSACAAHACLPAGTALGSDEALMCACADDPDGCDCGPQDVGRGHGSGI